MGAPGTCKEVLRDHLVKAKSFQDITPKRNAEFGFDMFSDSLVNYMRGLYSRDKDIIMSRTFFELIDVHYPVRADFGLLHLQPFQIKAIDNLYDRISRDIPPPDAIYYLKNNYISASNRMQMRGDLITHEVFDGLCEGYDRMIKRMNMAVHTIEVGEEDSVFYGDIDFSIDSFRRESRRDGTIWNASGLFKG